MPTPRPWTCSMRKALLACSTISAIRCWSITSTPPKPWTSGRLMTCARATSYSTSCNATRAPPMVAPTANMQRLAISAMAGGLRKAWCTGPLSRATRALSPRQSAGRGVA